MLKVTEQLIREIKELKGECIKLMCNEDMVQTMDKETFSLMQRTMNLIDLSCEVNLRQAKTLDDMNRKLDKLLSRK